MNTYQKLVETANLLLDISSLLMVSAANTSRVKQSIDRFASVLNFKASILITHKTLIVTLLDEGTDTSCTRVENIPPTAINFSIIAAISKASWSALDENWSFEEIEKEMERIKGKKGYPKIVVLLAVSLAGAGFCNIFKGDYLNMLLAFISTFMGLFVFQQAHRLKYNLYIRIFLGSLIASLTASIGIVYHIGDAPQTALATSILFLVPGVALINSFTDFIDNNIINGLVRFAMGLMTVLAMAMGLFIAMYMFQLN